MRAPYRIGIAGPGGLGLCAIREIMRLPEMELAAVLAYSPSKDGKDAGELANIPATGVIATTDLNTFLKTKMDCVLHCGRDFGDWRTDAEMLQMLEAGINVITMLPYHYLKARGEDVEARFQAAAKKGGATFHGSGITPGFFNERMALLATGLSNDVTHIKFQEFINAEPLAGALEMLQLFGFGSPLEVVQKSDAAAMLAENYLCLPIHYAADRLGVKVDRIVRTGALETAPETFETPAMTINKGTVGLVSYSWTGYSGDKPFYTTEVFWYLGEIMRPKTALANDFWTIEIEGRPSLKIAVSGHGSYKDDLYMRPEEPMPPSYIMTVVTMVQAVPNVVNAPPGVLLPDMPQVHWKPDLRQ
ncbi:MAG: hypothetical protein ABWZ40_05605 [Caulobacterales bacterium]